MGAESADIESSYTFCVRYFNEKNGLGLASSVQKKWVLKIRSKIEGTSLNSRNKYESFLPFMLALRFSRLDIDATYTFA